jgi:hypothetical protein
MHSTRSQRCQLVPFTSEKLHLLQADPAESGNRGDGEVQLFVGLPLSAVTTESVACSEAGSRASFYLYPPRFGASSRFVGEDDPAAVGHCVSDFIAQWQANRFESLPLCFDSAGADPLEMYQFCANVSWAVSADINLCLFVFHFFSCLCDGHL